jgi:hypothetical protein
MAWLIIILVLVLQGGLEMSLLFEGIIQFHKMRASSYGGGALITG